MVGEERVVERERENIEQQIKHANYLSSFCCCSAYGERERELQRQQATPHPRFLFFPRSPLPAKERICVIKKKKKTYEKKKKKKRKEKTHSSLEVKNFKKNSLFSAGADEFAPSMKSLSSRLPAWSCFCFPPTPSRGRKRKINTSGRCCS